MATQSNLHRTYSEAEIDELKAWFSQQTLPKTLKIDKATTVPNLQDTMESLFEQAYLCRENPKMLGCIRLIEKIKTILSEDK
ncbi:MAG: DUF6965 family protein [Phocaeicola sp.]